MIHLMSAARLTSLAYIRERAYMTWPHLRIPNTEWLHAVNLYENFICLPDFGSPKTFQTNRLRPWNSLQYIIRHESNSYRVTLVLRLASSSDASLSTWTNPLKPEDVPGSVSSTAEVRTSATNEWFIATYSANSPSCWCLTLNLTALGSVIERIGFVFPEGRIIPS